MFVVQCTLSLYINIYTVCLCMRWCTLYSVQYQSKVYNCNTLYTIQCIVYTVYCNLVVRMYTVHCQCTLCIVHCMHALYNILYTVQCTIYTVHCTVYIVQSILYSVQFTVYNIKYVMYSVHV